MGVVLTIMHCGSMMCLEAAGKLIKEERGICRATRGAAAPVQRHPVIALTCCLERPSGAAVPPTTPTHPAGILLPDYIIFILLRAGDDVNALSGSQKPLVIPCTLVIP